MNNGTVNNKPAATVVGTTRAGDIASLGETEDLELLNEAIPDTILDSVGCPLADVEIPRGGVIRGDGWDAAQDVERGALAEGGREEALPAGMGGLAGRGARSEVAIGEAVDGGEEALDGGEGAVIAADLDVAQARGEGCVLEGGGELVRRVHGEVENGLGEAEARDELERDGEVARADADDLAV